jgi:hypothetical protein
MRLDRLSRGQRIAAASSVLLFLFMWLPWFGDRERKVNGIVLPQAHVTINAWKSFDLVDIALLLIVVGTIAAIFQSSRRNDRNLSAAASLAVAAAGAVATLLIAYRVFVPLQSTSIRFGILLGLLAAIGIAVGGLLWAETEGGTVTDARERMGKAIEKARTSTAPRN